jgi:hypothetical protein
MMSAVLDEPLEESTLWQKRIRALQQWYQELSLKLDSLTKTVHDIGKPLQSRGPDPDSEEQRYTQEEVRFLMGTAAQEARRNYGGIHKIGGSTNINTVMLTVLTLVVIPGGAWIISTLITHGEQLAQIRCQLSPSSCLQLQVPHAN